jgi:hypothetical protein
MVELGESQPCFLFQKISITDYEYQEGTLPGNHLDNLLILSKRFHSHHTFQ